ncbi:hypothetical protein MKX08_007198 [Trichoderma sp. CBMAI-0020]|nr:hypothetical protein MKX08_007198 [Trichoderma sp. CBMAI-0020]
MDTTTANYNGGSSCISQGLATAIIFDFGSTDCGPQELASMSMAMPRTTYLKDMRRLVRAVVDHHVQLIISSAGGDGSDAHVQVIVGCVKEVLDEMEDPISLKVSSIKSNISHNPVLQCVQSGYITC